MTRRVLPPLLGLLALAIGVQAWCVWAATTPALDCVRYVGAAQQMAHLGWPAALQANPEQPGFPTLVWAMHSARCAAGGSPLWGLSAQIAAATGLVLCVIPIYYWLRRIAGSAGGLIGCCAFVVLPGVARLGADGLSDAWQLLWLACATTCASAVFGRPRVPVERGDLARLACTGLFSGLALLTRAESLVFPPACLAVILWHCRTTHQVSPGDADAGRNSQRARWRALVLSAGSYCTGCALPLVIVFALAGVTSPRDALTRLTGGRAADQVQPLNAPAALVWPLTEKQARRLYQTADSGPPTFGRKDQRISERSPTAWAAGRDYVRELAGALHPLLIAGLLSWVLFARRRRWQPALRLPAVAAGLLALLLLWLTLTRGYISLRHFLPVALWSLPCAATGLHRLSVRLAALAGNLAPLSDRLIALGRVRIAPAAWTAACCLAICLPTAVRPVHASRAGHRAAAEYLTSHASPGARVLDTRGWTALLHGLPTYGGESTWAALLDPQLQFVVLEAGELHAATPRGASFRELLATCCTPAAICQPPSDAGATVCVYRFDRARWVRRQPELAAHAPRELPAGSAWR